MILATLDVELNQPGFTLGLPLFGVGAGLLASQLGNVIMSAAPPAQTNEAGGLQGTAQNLGASLGTALIGAVLLIGLTTSFANIVENDQALPVDMRTPLAAQARETGLEVVTVEPGRRGSPRRPACHPIRSRPSRRTTARPSSKGSASPSERSRCSPSSGCGSRAICRPQAGRATIGRATGTRRRLPDARRRRPVARLLMDLHVIGPLASPAERAAVDAVLGPPESGWVGGPRDARTDGHAARGGHATRARRSQLLPALHAVQSRIGWISQPALNYISRRLAVAPAEAYGVATFYALYATTPRNRRSGRAPTRSRACAAPRWRSAT